MATPVANSVPLTGNPFVDGLIQGSSWQFGGGPHTLTYSLDLNFDGPTTLWTMQLTAAVAGAFAAWSAVANVQFVQTGTPNTQAQNHSSADIALALDPSTDAAGILLGLGIFPDPAFADQILSVSGYTRNSGTFPVPNPEGDIVYFTANNQFNPNGAHGDGPGSIGFSIVLHEIGHALGLKHADDDGGNDRPTFADLGIAALDSTNYTLMSNDDPHTFQAFTTRHSSTPMPLDILAIQQIYGANLSYHTGDDIYVPQDDQTYTIWDAGGIDTIDGNSYGFAGNFGVVIDLRPGNFSHVNYPSNLSGSDFLLGIAYGATIENATGTFGTDVMIGNDANNVLNGFSGADTMTGGKGDDTYVVWDSGDLVIENPGEGMDLVQSRINYVLPANVENLTLTGSTIDQQWINISGTGNELDNVISGDDLSNMLSGLGGDDQLFGGAGDDTLVGGAGLDFLDGGPGLDELRGGAGNDTYVVDNVGDAVIENANEGTDLIQSSVTYTLPANVENLTLTGSGNLSGTGNNLDNTFISNSGIDALAGGPGNDVYFLNNAGDTVTENSGEGIDTVVAGFSFTLAGTNLENVTLTGGAGLTATGNAFANVLTSNTGIDTLIGGLGNDTYVLNNAAVTIVENAGEGTDTVMTSFSYSLAPGSNLENVTLTGFNLSNATGDGLNNILTGSSGQNMLTGGLGNDTLIGGFALDTARFNGAMSSYAITHTGTSGTVTGPDGTDSFSSVERLQFDDQSLALVTPKSDFNGDLTSDLVWRNNDGTVAIWSMQDATHFSATVAGLIPTSWHVSGTGDFNGDGKSDVLWHGDDGLVAVWTMQDATHFSATVAGLIPTSWHVSGTGDFNGDGKSDVLWHGDDGLVAVWTMQDATHFSATVAGLIPTSWHVSGTGDFNGDGKSDVLWHGDDGLVAVWTMQDATHFSADVTGMIPTSWQVGGTGDFNGDRKSDVLWHANDGTVAVWTMQDATHFSVDVAAVVPASWHIAGTPDVNGDGKSDVLWRIDNGQVAVWTMQDATYHTTEFSQLIPNDWMIA